MTLPMRLAVVALVASCAAGCSRSTPRAARRTLIIGTGARGANFHPVGLELAEVYRTDLPEFDVEVSSVGGAVSNLDRLQSGDAELAFSFADVAYAGYVGQLPGAAQPDTRLRAMALLQLEPVQVIVSDRSPVAGIRGLAGRRVKSGAAGSASNLATERLLKAYGVDQHAVMVDSGAPDESVRALAAGRLDAMVFVSRAPSDLIQTAISAGAHLLELGGGPIERLHQEHPFLSPVVIPAGTYRGQSQAITTVGMNGVLLCRADLAEDLVYRLTRAMFQAVGEQRVRLLQPMPLGRAAATPIPLHPGAARFYRERELFP